MLTYSGRVLACFEHSNLFKVNEPELRSGLRLGRGGEKKKEEVAPYFFFSPFLFEIPKAKPWMHDPEGSLARARDANVPSLSRVQVNTPAQLRAGASVR